jgi:hypothetical protein
MFVKEITKMVECAIEGVHFAEEHHAEMRCQFDSEVAHYGDAWPGAVQDVQRAFEGVGQSVADMNDALYWEAKFYGLM